MKHMKEFMFIAGLVFLWILLPFLSQAQVPGQINFQGKATDTDGNPLNATYAMKFHLYNDLIDGNELWSEEQSVLITDGVFNVNLGAVVPLSEGIFSASFVGIEVEIYNPGEAVWEILTPRQRLISTAYAFRADNADTLDGIDSTAFISADSGLADLDNNNLLVQGVGSFDNSGEEGTLFLGDTNNYIKAVHGSGVSIGTFDAAEAIVVEQGTGNVGIGTSTPEAKLDVAGRVHVSGTLQVGSSAKNLAIFTDGVVVDLASTGASLGINYPGNNDTVINVDGGRVGIGTAVPDEKLTVAGIVKSTSGGFKFPDGTLQAGAGITEETDPQVGSINNGKVPYWNGTQLVSGAIHNSLFVQLPDTQWRVGMGTNNPEGMLHISAGTTGDARLILEADTDNNDEGDQAFMEFWQDGGNIKALMGFDGGENDLKFRVAGSNNDAGIRFFTGSLIDSIQRMRITAGGHVQVGSDSKYLSMWSTGSLVDLASTGSGLAINYSGNPTVMNVAGGKVGIGTENPTYGKLHVYTNEATNAIYGISTGGGSGLYAVSTNTTNGLYGAECITYSNNPLHAGVFADNQGAGPGIIATAGSEGYAGKFNGIVSVKVLEITGADLSEQYNVRNTYSSMLPMPGQVVSIDPENPGDLLVSHVAYDRKVAGIISGAGDISIGMLMGKEGHGPDGKNPIALTGRVYCLADASTGAIVPGDLLTTSNTPGHAMKVMDYGDAQGAILGKAMTSLDENKGLVLVLVTLQ